MPTNLIRRGRFRSTGDGVLDLVPGDNIAAAVAELNASGGGLVRLADGEYEASNVPLLGRVDVEGRSAASCKIIITGSGNGVDVTGIASDGRSALRNVWLLNGGTAEHGIYATRRFLGENLIIQHFGKDGVRFTAGADPGWESPYFSELRHVECAYSGESGVRVMNVANVVMLTQVDTKWNQHHGILIAGGWNTIVMGGQGAYNVRCGLKVEASFQAHVYAFYAEGNSKPDEVTDPTGEFPEVHFDSGCSQSYAVLGDIDGEVRVDSQDRMIVYEGGALISNFQTTVKGIDFGDDGAGDAFIGPASAATRSYGAGADRELRINTTGNIPVRTRVGGNVRFGVVPDGVEMRMMGAVASGSIVNAVPVFNAADGSFVGYMPVYASIT
jgi:hypothetical protein